MERGRVRGHKMDELTVVVTGSGAPGIAGTLHSLRENFDSRRVRVVGTDVQEDVIGRYVCDGFRAIPRPSSPDYVDSLKSLCRDTGAAIIVPQNTAELEVIARAAGELRDEGVEVVVSPERAIRMSNDKDALTTHARALGVPVPTRRLVSDIGRLEEAASALGWPERKVVIKPPSSNGMRGVRIIDESIDLKRLYYEEKPTSLYTRMDQVRQMLGDEFPPLMVMEHLPGAEYTVDVFRGNDVLAIPRRRDRIVSGITFAGTVEKREDLMEWSARLSRSLGLDYAFGFQFKLDSEGVPKLLECNPRVQGTMVLSTMAGANIIYAAVKKALGEEVPPMSVNWGTRIMRYWGGVGIADGRLTVRI